MGGSRFKSNGDEKEKIEKRLSYQKKKKQEKEQIGSVMDFFTIKSIYYFLPFQNFLADFYDGPIYGRELD